MVILDMEQRTLAVDGHSAAELLATSTLLLELLIRRRGRYVSIRAICLAVMSAGRESEDPRGYAAKMIFDTRRAVSHLGITIRNRRGIGYTLVMPEGVAFPVVVHSGDGE